MQHHLSGDCIVEMTDLVETFGFSASSNTDVFLFCAIFTFSVVTILWVVGLRQGNHSMMDGWYGFAYVVPALFAYLISDAASVTAGVLLVMVGLHGCRLGWYLASRWRRYVPVHGGDPRYIGFAEKFSPGYWWKSFFRVMEPQAVVIVLIGSPAVAGIVLTREPDGQLGILAAVGLVVFAVGLYFESLADGQLQAFLALDKRPRYLNTGVWKHSRHPNYFGTTTVWWGIWLVAIDGNIDAWWTLIGPIANTIMLTGLFGSAFQDKYMGARPEYQQLMARTRRFFPLPVSRAEREANERKIEATQGQQQETVAVG
jgi:steroid 5-alpha reductase family enzyme